MTLDYGYAAQQAAEKHLQAIEAAEDAADETGDSVAYPQTAGPWCGCTTCVVRETLYAAWPILLQAARAELTEAG